MKRLVSILMVFVLVLGLAACGGSGNTSSGGGADPAPSSGAGTAGEPSGEAASAGGEKSLTMSLYAEIGILDPHRTSAAWDTMMIQNLHDSLLRFANDGSVVASVAKEWNVSPDGMTYTFKLRDDIKFQNGTPLTASDVKFSLERAMDNADSRRTVAFIDTVEVVNDYEVIIHAKNPCAGGLRYLATANTSILSEAYVNEVGSDEYTNKPCGTGPFMVDEFISGDRVVLKANPDYFLGKASIDTLTVRTIKESTTAMIALETGEVDMIVNVPEMDKRNIMQNDKLEVQETSAAIFWTLLMNTQQEPYTDKRVRQAIYMAIDPQEIIDIVLDGAGMVSDGPLHPLTNGYVESERWPYDIERAKELLAEAGFPEGFSATISVREDFTQKTAQVIQSQLAKIGITLDINVMQFNAWLGDAIEGKHEIWPMGFQDVILDCELPLSQLNSAGLGSTNYTQYSSPDFDELHNALLVETDPAKRVELITALVEYEKESAVRVPMYFQMNNVAYNKRVKNAYVMPNSNYFFYYFDVE